MKPHARRALAALATSLVLGACAAMSGSPRGLDGTAWVLASLPGHALIAEALPTARFADGRVQGSDGCNRYTAPYTSSGSSVQVGPRGASTMMACAPAVMKQAEAFMAALTKAAAFRVVDGQLELQAADGAVVATFAAQRETLAGTSWRVTAYNNGRQAVVGAKDGTALTIAFSEDGRVSGSAGCNSFSATFKQAGAKLSIGPAAATRKMCAAPAGVMEQEREFLKALETVATARAEGDRLELRTADDALAVMATRSN
ncbi:MAG: META domain-containing protein [Burkholderiales bacterium]|nr:META domain-containing protein [Burkholderiales bacterium]